MRRPKAPGSPIDLARVREWATEFSGYRHAVGEDRIRAWLKQFQKRDRDLAARVLDSVDFVTHEQMSAAFRQILPSLEGWHITPSKRRGRWRFIAYSASAGESGDSMLHKFRHANNLASRSHNELFVHRSDLLREGLGKDDTVVLVDDFVGTGSQVCEAWGTTFGELLAEVGKVYLVVVAARGQAMERVREETDLEIIPHIELTGKDNVFACNHFNNRDRSCLEHYGKKADPKIPKGYGDCGLVMVFAHSCPNNTIPILHAKCRKWEGLFRRYD